MHLDVLGKVPIIGTVFTLLLVFFVKATFFYDFLISLFAIASYARANAVLLFVYLDFLSG